MEHHSNLVPWQMLAAERGLRLEFVPVTDDGQLDLEAYRALLEQGPRLVAFTHMSNVLGYDQPGLRRWPPWRTRPGPSSWWMGPSRCRTCR